MAYDYWAKFNLSLNYYLCQFHALTFKIKSISSLISSLLRLVIEGSKNEIKLDFETRETKLTQLIVERQDSSDNSIVMTFL